ncbi:MAG: xylulokinase [Armatimonadetes bacterium]|nr:xylulokinase [Armatimonadota bacterium]
MPLLGIDIGTTGTKTLLTSEAGQVLASATAEYPLSMPRPGWAEQEPAHWWEATVATVRQALDRAGVSGADILGVGLSGQMHGSVFLDGKGRVLRPAILWCDQRTAAECEWITERVGAQRVVELTSNPVLTGFSAPKIIWLRNFEPETYTQIRKVLLPKDYIRYRLTGAFATEVSDASGTSLFHVRERRWATELLDAIELPTDWLPECYESPIPSAHISAEAAAATGLRAGTPVVGGGGDQAAGAVGNGIVEPGIVSSTVGTSGVVFAHSDAPVVDPGLRVHTFCHAVPGAWHQMGVMLSAGGSLRWYRDVLAGQEREVAAALGVDPYELITREAAGAPPGSEGLVFLPYLTGERTPYPDPYARGVYFGLSLRHDRRYLARAVLEGVAYGLRDSFAILDEMRVPIRQVRASGGGARSTLWRQIQADVTGREHVTLNVDEGPAFGVALLAGVGTGVWSSVPEACRATIRVVDRCAPDEERRVLYDRYYSIYRGLYPTLKNLFREAAAVAGG